MLVGIAFCVAVTGEYRNFKFSTEVLKLITIHVSPTVYG